MKYLDILGLVFKGLSNISLVIILLCCLTVSACQTISNKENELSDHSHDSLALQVVKAAGVSKGLVDVPISQIDESMLIRADTKSVDLGLAVAHSQNLLSPPSGISNWGAAGLHLLSILTTPTVQESEQSKLLVWMPATDATGDIDAQLRMGVILENAAIAALPEDYSGKREQWTDIAVFGAKSIKRVIKVNGPLCPGWSCVIKGAFPSDIKPGSSGKMKLVSAPSFIPEGTSDSYSYARQTWVMLYKITDEYDEKDSVNGHWHRLETEPLAEFEYDKWYVELSKHLPDWAYYYHSPYRRDKRYSFFPVPLVLNGGEANYFIYNDSLSTR